jgi:hypothetical protein
MIAGMRRCAASLSLVLLVMTEASCAIANGAPVEAAAPHEAPVLPVPALHALGLFTVMRVTEAHLWPDPFSFHRTSRWQERYGQAFTARPLFDPERRVFEWDGDHYTINVFGHGLLGSELYLRARACRFDWYGSLAFAAAASAVWEYGFEANGVRPSGLDLVFTPLAGLAIGEARYQSFRAAGSIDSPLWRGVLRTVLDPLGEFERALGTVC